MIKQDDGSYRYEFEGQTYSFLNDDEMYRRFYAGVPIEDIAKARDKALDEVIPAGTLRAYRERQREGDLFQVVD